MQTKLEEHLGNVRDFHAMLKIHTDWLGNAEKVLATFKYPSKLVDRVLRQIQNHKVCCVLFILNINSNYCQEKTKISATFVHDETLIIKKIQIDKKYLELCFN